MQGRGEHATRSVLGKIGCPASHGQDGKTVGHERHEAEFLSYSMICLSIDKHSSVFIPC